MDLVRPSDHAVGAACAGQHARLHQNAYAFFQEQRITFARLEQPKLELREFGRVAEQAIEQFVGTHRLKRIDAQLRVVSPASPAVPIFGPVVDQQQHATGGHALNQAVEQCLGFAVDPMQIFEHQGERLSPAFAYEQPLDPVQGASSPLGWIKRVPSGVLGR